MTDRKERGPTPLAIEFVRRGEMTYVVLSGELTVDSGYTLFRAIRLREVEASDYVVDLRGVTSIGFVGLCELVESMRWARSRNVTISFIQGDAQVQEIFREYEMPGHLGVLEWVDPPEGLL